MEPSFNVVFRVGGWCMRCVKLFLVAGFVFVGKNSHALSEKWRSRPFAFTLSVPSAPSLSSAPFLRRSTSVNSYIPGAINLLAGDVPSPVKAASESPEDRHRKEIRMQRVSSLVSSPIFVFMKGTPDAPQCGYSNAVVQMLRACGVADVPYFDILSDEEIKAGAKEFADWQTFPQLYVQGKFIGGADIVASMFKDGSLKNLLDESGVTSTASS